MGVLRRKESGAAALVLTSVLGYLAVSWSASAELDIRASSTLSMSGGPGSYAVFVDDCSSLSSVTLSDGAGATREVRSVEDAEPSAGGCVFHFAFDSNVPLAPIATATYSDGTT